MNLGDLLDELRVGILNDRSDRVSGSSDYLWTDTRLVRYINEAQKRWARLTLCIRDNTTPDVVEVTLQTGVANYQLHRSVLALISARYQDDAKDLYRAGHSAFDGYKPPDTYFWNPDTLNTLPAGKPIAVSTDETISLGVDGTVGTVNLRVYPAPTSDYNGKKIYLRVCRLPLVDLNVKNTKQIPEVPEMHHMEMLDWAAYLALRIVDQDAGDTKRAEDFAASFDANAKRSRTDLMRKLFANAAWGFGRGGWNWSR